MSMMYIFRCAEMTACRMCLKRNILLPCTKFNSRILKRIDTFPKTNQQSMDFAILGIPLNTQDISNTKCQGHQLSKKNGFHMGQVNLLKNNVQYYYQDLNRIFSTTSVYNRSSDKPHTPDKDSSKDIKDIKEQIMNIPNVLTMSRIVATPFLGYLVVQEAYTPAFCIFVAAGMTDVLDGYIARNFNQMTVLGSALDPLADKLLVSVLTVTLTMSSLMPVPLAAVILGRDVLLILASLYFRYISLPPPKTFSRYCDVTNATVKLHPSNISKLNTFLQLTLIASSLAAPVFGFVDHIALQTLWYLTGTTTIASGVGYYRNRHQSVEILQDKMKH
ncbi:cardiolipin synthase (CMP-forming)-like isoform X2 [Mytilus edulis]|uniref:cardiolipin synthase (CMP-forming)-like isoform X2 n=1 Tax=Mytilus edulis TaxID=6550 RepID=UPI0039EE3E7E